MAAVNYGSYMETLSAADKPMGGFGIRGMQKAVGNNNRGRFVHS
jgi:hypothetical protein